MCSVQPLSSWILRFFLKETKVHFSLPVETGKFTHLVLGLIVLGSFICVC